MTSRTGLLIGKSLKNIGNFLKLSFQNEKLGTLYVKLLCEKNLGKSSSTKTSNSLINRNILGQTIIDCYKLLKDTEVDVRVILTNSRDSDWLKVITSKPIEIVYFDSSFTASSVENFIHDNVTNKSKNYRIVPLPAADDEGDSNFVESQKEEFKYYDSVVLGGTFDRIHNGHKILFTEAILRCRKQLTVGVTCDEMLKSKVLCELIDDCHTRMKSVKEFLRDVNPILDYHVIEIFDMYGPTKTDPTFEMIVVSKETEKGGDKINECRKANGLNTLDIVSIDLLDCFKESSYEEEKLSSSNYRMRMLGKLLKPPSPRPHLPSKPYIIGLTGGIASGKTSISNYLKEYGCGIVNCDELGHRMYDIGSSGYHFIKDNFGLKVMNEDGSVNRQQLASIVFSDPKLLVKLNEGLWPLILDKVKDEIVTRFMDKEVVVIEAALLIQANWTEQCHEIWSCVIPREEAVKRLQERNHLSGEEAEKRINSQADNREYVSYANVIFCTYWECDFTKKQVEMAWLKLKKRLPL